MPSRLAGMDCEGACSSFALVVVGWACFHGATILRGDFTPASTNMAVYGVMQLGIAGARKEQGVTRMARPNGAAGWFGGSAFHSDDRERRIWVWYLLLRH